METAFKGFTEGMLVESKPVSQEIEVVESASGAAAMELFTETEVIGNFEGESYQQQQHQPQQQVVLFATTLGGGRSSEIISNSKTTDVSLSHDYERENLKGIGENEVGFVEADETVIVSAQTKTSTTVQTEGREYTLTVADANAVAPSLIVEQQLQDAAKGSNEVLPTEECDRLTDSNSSEKMSFDDNNSAMISRSDGIDEQSEDSADEYGEDSGNVPMNFPIKGRILARLRLHGKGHEYFMTKQQLVIGRNSSKGAVDIDIGHSSFISRNHLTIVYEEGDFFLSCGGKNGVFVDDTFQKIGAPRLTLPKSCALRFPSTQIVIIFDAAERFIDQYSTTNTKNSTVYDVDNPPKVLKALSVQIPENGRVGELKRSGKVFFSPCPSPSGTISAVNSCPASPTSAVVYSRNAASAGHRAIQPKVPAEPSSGKDDRIPLFEGDDSKPPYSYAQLIVQAISSSPDKQMTLSGIYSYIARNYSYFKGNERGWQNSIRHNLSLNRYFIKVARSLDEPGKGCFWSIDPISEPKLVAQAFRRRNKRGIPFFRGTPKTLKTQSAPVSPSPIIIHPAIYTSDMKTGSTSLSAASVAAGSGAASPAVVTVATVNSIVEAVNMQRKKSHVLDLNSLRAIQSAPGSPQGFKILSQASLKTAGVAPKATPAPITLLQPITGEEKGAPQLVPSGTVLSVASTPAVSMVTNTVPTVVSSINSEQPKLAISRAAVHGQPIFIQLAPSSIATTNPQSSV